jgi:hypothetical protein
MDITKEMYEGQQQINGALCRVDWRLIQVLRMIHNIFVELRPHVPPDVLDKLERAINDADVVSARVASIKPPGCVPELREEEDPTYMHAATNSPSIQP